MTPLSIEKVRELEKFCAKMPQEAIETVHVIHAGMYARTILVPAGVLITGVLVKRATLIIIHGDVVMYTDRTAVELHDYNVVPAAANRKVAFLALKETNMTMVFPSDAKTVGEAEAEFTDETDMLVSRRDGCANQTIITED